MTTRVRPIGNYVGRFFLFGAASIFLLLSLTGCADQDQKSRRKPVSAVSAQTYEVTEASMPDMEVFSGRTKAKIQAVLASNTSGFVREVRVREGDVVKKGDLLLTIDDTRARSEIESAMAEKAAMVSQKAAVMADLAYAKANFERLERLKKEDAATQEEFDRALARFKALENQASALDANIRRIEANLNEARNQLSYVSLVSPVNGLIVEKTVDPGSYVNPGTPLLKIDAVDSGYWFDADIDEALLARTKPGDNVYLSIPSAHISEAAKITRVVPYVNPLTHTFNIKIDLKKQPDHDLIKSGLYGKVILLKGHIKCLVVPEKALVTRGGMTAVYTVGRDRIVHWRVVKTGRKWIYEDGTWMPYPGSGQGRHGDVFVEILSGVNPKDTVVVSNLDMVQEGVRLE
ncbi:MAG: efflux RND transporter periplasmic adaptor subunit [Dissulfurimicrobium sp.]|uniref:efflux RND transporter periplasmic adaptor subunit n=1 Tax=Dissulfurimicrobium TaxID=1769732 RepID=UPI001ED9FD2A|nr:efflux RND transporter periplasmic adaptor subunit [Dissulfurimicrobium hydrothermale]UKL13149.1 efflux RND transporter periplasmic adaptor subunit [Dissulfurimicrobium hydrothermale]